jgi:signal peptide peptidase SppA
MPSPLTYLLQSLSGPLLVDPRVGAAMAQILSRKLLQGEQFTGGELHAEMGVGDAREQAAARAPAQRQATEARIALIPVYGIIAQRAHSFGCSTEAIGAALDAAMADTRVDAVLFDVDSPGGTVPGVPELAAKIRAAAAVKPSLALSNSLAASAGYWLAAATGETWVTPSGDAGSIGVYTIHQDMRGYLEKEGVKITAVKAGTYKVEGAPWEELTPEAEAFLQDRVNEVYGWFVKDVAAFRQDTPAKVRAGYGEGRVLGAKQSLEANLVDQVGTFEEAVARLSQRVQGGRRGPRAELLRERMALDAA